MKSTLFALLLSLAFQGSAFAQLRITYLDEMPPFADPETPFWVHTLTTYADGNQGIVFAYDGLCSNTGGHSYLFEAVALEITNLGSNAVTVQYTMSLVCGGSSPSYPEPFIDNPILNDQITGDWKSLGRPNLWAGTVTIPAGFATDFCGFYQMEGSLNFNLLSEPEGSCCVNSGCASIAEADCSEMGGTWTEDGSCDDCEPVADDCPADVDGDGEIGFSDVLIILNDWGACP